MSVRFLGSRLSKITLIYLVMADIIRLVYDAKFNHDYNGIIYGPPHMAKQKQDDQPELTYSS